jgi:hypothetical protein
MHLGLPLLHRNYLLNVAWVKTHISDVSFEMFFVLEQLSSGIQLIANAPKSPDIGFVSQFVLSVLKYFRGNVWLGARKSHRFFSFSIVSDPPIPNADIRNENLIRRDLRKNSIILDVNND